jgi:hypothetical protein
MAFLFGALNTHAGKQVPLNTGNHQSPAPIAEPNLRRTLRVQIMKVFSGFLNQNIHNDYLMVGKERMKVLREEAPFNEAAEERYSSSTSSLLMVLIVHPDRASSDPVWTSTRFDGDI